MLGGRFEVMRKQGNMFQAAGGSRPRALPHGGSGGSAGKQRHEPDPLRALLRCSPVTAGVNGGLQRCSLVVAGAGNGPMLAGEASRRGRPGQAGGAGGGDSGAAHQDRQDDEQTHFQCWVTLSSPGGAPVERGAGKSGAQRTPKAGPGKKARRNYETMKPVAMPIIAQKSGVRICTHRSTFARLSLRRARPRRSCHYTQSILWTGHYLCTAIPAGGG